jgi:DNA polymerase zeta
MLNNRQLGLKMIANVTYGYTSASFSGRMPCIEIADSIVQTARDTLEAAIRLVENTKEWNAKVIYGDTDSMFVLLEGATREEAFKIGEAIASRVTAMNPKPVKLQFEKVRNLSEMSKKIQVYHPCILVSKKRYVGYKYESVTQREPVFEAKGIETVRRDTCPAVAKVMAKSLQ